MPETELAKLTLRLRVNQFGPIERVEISFEAGEHDDIAWRNLEDAIAEFHENEIDDIANREEAERLSQILGRVVDAFKAMDEKIHKTYATRRGEGESNA
jgi:hypothetical protein